MKFKKYNQIHIEARQAISDTELMFHKEMREDHKRDNFDQFWQEKLNAANLKVLDIFFMYRYIVTIILLFTLFLVSLWKLKQRWNIMKMSITR